MGDFFAGIGGWIASWDFGWFPDFAQSPGFAGVLAVVAAIVAYAAATKNAKKERWWKRAEYALNMLLSDEAKVRTGGLAILGAMDGDKEENLFIRRALGPFLEEIHDEQLAASTTTGTSSTTTVTVAGTPEVVSPPEAPVTVETTAGSAGTTINTTAAPTAEGAVAPETPVSNDPASTAPVAEYTEPPAGFASRTGTRIRGFFSRMRP
jgi:hypothetical protein